MSTSYNVWTCQQVSTDCTDDLVDIAIIYNDALKCFLNSPKHLFDCSGVTIINDLKSEFPKSDDNSACIRSDQSWYPNTYHRPFTNWTYASTAQNIIGKNGRVCVYSNGYNIAGAPFNTIDIANGRVSGFQDPNKNENVTSYRRIYCIYVILNSGSSSYECTQGLFHVSMRALLSYSFCINVSDCFFIILL